MPLTLPNLDDRTYADLVEEARRLIPSLDPRWTNHNPSDPGITLVELFASLTEILNYRLNRVTEANQRRFLDLLRVTGEAPVSSGDLTADTRKAVRAVRARYRAVSPSDYELVGRDDFNDWLASMQRAQDAGGDPTALEEWWRTTGLDAADQRHQPRNVPAVGRARCVPGRNLERGTEEARCQPDPGHVSLMVVPLRDGPQEVDPLLPPPVLRQALWGFLDERRTLTTRHHVVGAIHAPVSADVVLARTADAVTENLRGRVVQKLNDFLDPLQGGPSGDGWPFGRDVYVSELVEQMEGIPGVDYVTDVMLSSACAGGDARCVPAPLSWHAGGDLIGLQLASHHLPRIDPGRIVIAPHASFLPVRIKVTLDAAGDPAQVRRLVKSGLRALLHPLLGGPGPDTSSPTDIMRSDLEGVLHGVPASGSLAVDVDPDRLLRKDGGVTGFRVRAGEVIHWRISFNDSGAVG